MANSIDCGLYSPEGYRCSWNLRWGICPYHSKEGQRSEVFDFLKGENPHSWEKTRLPDEEAYPVNLDDVFIYKRSAHGRHGHRSF